MINRIIQQAINQRASVLVVCFILSIFGVYATFNTPIDAIPDLSEVQVIVKTTYAGQSPQVVEDQVTYPLTTALLSVPKAKTVRGFSFFGDSFIYIIFDEGTDLYWARSRVQEYLSQVSNKLPPDAKPELGPDATGVGWIYMYALKDNSGQFDLAALTSLQDWQIRYALQTTQGVSEVATVGGMKKQYLIEINPLALVSNQVTLQNVRKSIQRNNQSRGASVIEQAEAEYMITVTGELTSQTAIENLPIKTTTNSTPILLKDIARIVEAPMPRRAVAEFNGEGEVVGGIVVMRAGANAQATIAAVKQQLQSIQANLPAGVEIVSVYDRSKLIEAAVTNLWGKLWQELLVVFLVTAFFLFHIRSALVALVLLPVGLLLTLLCLRLLNVNINIMSLGGIALAMGAMVDAAVVMVENLHAKYQHYQQQHNTVDAQIDEKTHWKLTTQACQEVGPAVFFSLLIITISFFPVFALQAEEGKLFTPLAYTKSFAMAMAAILGITLVPVLTGLLINGRSLLNREHKIDAWLVKHYQHFLSKVLDIPKTVMIVAILLCMSAIYPLQQLGTEFMPALDEGDIMYMPTTSPGISIAKARQFLQQAHRIIALHPEVAQVFGKSGRAETATDPAPLSMVESIIQLKPKQEWRKGVTLEQIKSELDASVKFPGVNNAWVMPIRARIDMQSTGVKTPLGAKISGPNLAEIQSLSADIEQAITAVQGTVSVYAEQPNNGRYIDIQINKIAAASFSLNTDDIQSIIQNSVAGTPITFTREGRERYAVSLRYAESYRHSIDQLLQLPLITSTNAWLTLGDVALIQYKTGPSIIKSENAQLSSWIYIDYSHANIHEYLQLLNQAIDEQVTIPAGYSVNWTGQYQSLQRASKRLQLLLPITLFIIVTLLYLSFKRVREVLIVLLTLPLALSGGLWLLYWMKFKLSIAVAIGLIALAGLAVEIGVLMLVYLQQSIKHKTPNETLKSAVQHGAGRRIRPILMTALSVAVGLLPILFDSGTGSEVMARIIAPVVGGVVSVLLLSLILLPVIYLYLERLTIAGNKDVPRSS